MGDEFIGVTSLRERGWTDAMIRDFLGAPHETKPNPRYRSAAPMKLWRLSQVKQVENSAAFTERKEAAQRRSAAARQASNRRAAETVAAVNAVEVSVPLMHTELLQRRAVRHRNRREEHRSLERGYIHDPADVEQVDEATLQRWCVNYLRHCLTTYDSLLDGLTGKVARVEAAALLRRKVYAAIAAAYPQLAAECNRQQTARQWM